MRRLRLLQSITCFSVLLCFLTYAVAEGSEKNAANTSESILSDTSGEIEEVVLQYSSSLGVEILPTYKSFLKQIESDTVVYVVCENADQVRTFRIMLENWGILNSERFKVTNAGREITVWARDRFVVKSTKDNLRKRIVVLPNLPRSECNDRLNDKQVPVIIAEANGTSVEARESRLFFEGGNIVTSDKYLFTGYSTVMDPKLPSDDDVIRLLGDEFGRKVIVVGTLNTPEPNGHIDMYLTPISDKVVLLGDPTLAKNILVPECEEHEAEETQLVEEESSEEDYYLEKESVPTEEVLRSYDLVKKQLERKGFKVERIPIVHDEHGCAITYNNVLMEARNGKRIVYMPVYGIEKLDAVATKKFQSLGFEVRPVDVSRIYRFGGTLRCVTNVLARRTVQNSKREERHEHLDSVQPEDRLRQLP